MKAVMLATVTSVSRRYWATYILAFVGLVIQITYSAYFMATIAGCYELYYDSSTRSTPTKLKVLIVFCFFSFYWTSQVFENIVHVTISGVFATYYFLFGSEQGMTKSPTVESFKRACTTSIGSICFGSLVIAIIQTLRAIAQMARGDGSDGIMAFVACLIDCILGCLQGIAEYINKYAFCQVAIYGKAYLPAAKDTWTILKDRGIEQLINDNLIGNVFSMGAILCGVLSGLGSYLYLRFANPAFNANGDFTWILILMGFVMGLQIMFTISVVIDSGVATTFVCLAEDPAALARTKPELFERIRATWPAVVQLNVDIVLAIMSTFDGLVREFPSIKIDNFQIRPGVSVYLLSHVHSDHLAGLATKSWDAPIYCSTITATWLPMLASRSNQDAFESGKTVSLLCKYAHLRPFLRPLSTDTSHYLELGNGRKVRLCLIPAHHCPGAVMFLLQDDRSCILYTGDARNEKADLMGLATMPAFSASAPRIDKLYIDTTCCHPGLYTFPSRDLVVSDLVKFITHRPRLAHYYIDAWTFGYEEIWIGLATAFNTKIHVSHYLYNLYMAIDGMISPKIVQYLTTDGTYARFHSCRLGSTCGYGGAGGSHSSVRELIRIQPNVSWFSDSIRNERMQDSVLVEGTTVMRGNSYSIKEKLPPSISKRDALCYVKFTGG
ncbi:putative choline transporter, neither null mutation nor overexpression affects choline transport [Gryganskiella cystojenkinii]|nr:putative choline transporter, neither null mutation nor overexpression affects choline transport [Gryganskiella cystojenkinii]